MQTRSRVTQWIDEYVKAHNLVTSSIVGELNHVRTSMLLLRPVLINVNVNAFALQDSRTVISRRYFDTLHQTEILVTVNPSEWEGDFRLWESLGT
jgi:hypothetical protein